MTIAPNCYVLFFSIINVLFWLHSNEKRLQAQIEKYEALKQSIKLIDNIIDSKPLSTSEYEGPLKVICDFIYVTY